ncbi:MAG: DegT/DnrJ/EryC1/StrS family aminotransferase [Rhizobiales bacterium]|nr:DegT/DnrJ/EryC1/StrS family aminotransferase [Hyphomicrobiales bacterium]
MLFVARPIAPDLETLSRYLKGCIEQRRFTNGGPLEATLELRLRELLSARHLCLVTNGTVAITLALTALGIRGQVITTPFTFSATTHAIIHAGAEEVFVDVDPVTLTIDPKLIEAAITPETEAIVGVHVYGIPCAVDEISAIAKKHGLAVIYDGAHAFNMTYRGTPIGRFGDATTYSFHATKLFHTAEGGAIEANSSDLAERLRLLRNFGIESEDVITACGTNAKMSEVSAAVGLAVLDLLGAEYDARAKLRSLYSDALKGIPDIRFLEAKEASDAGSYFIIYVPVSKRDELQNQLRQSGILARRYFYPLTSEGAYLGRQHDHRATPIAFEASRSVLALPYHGGVTEQHVALIAEIARRVLG